VALAHNATRWQQLRDAVVDGVRSSPLFDMGAYVRHLERAYHLMWELHAAGLPSRHIKVAPHVPDIERATHAGIDGSCAS
jgi:hypothetical protein